MTKTGSLLATYSLHHRLLTPVRDNHRKFSQYIRRKAGTGDLQEMSETQYPRQHEYVYLCIAKITDSPEHLEPGEFIVKIGQSYFVDQRLGPLGPCFPTYDLALIVERRILYDNTYGDPIAPEYAQILVEQPRTGCKAFTVDSYNSLAVTLNRSLDADLFPRYDEPGGPADYLQRK